MAHKIVKLANDSHLRKNLGRQARQHIRTLADPSASISRLESVLEAAAKKSDNPFAGSALAQAVAVASYLDQHRAHLGTAPGARSRRAGPLQCTNGMGDLIGLRAAGR